METERMPPRKWRWGLWSERPPIVIGPFRANLLKELDSWPGLGLARVEWDQKRATAISPEGPAQATPVPSGETGRQSAGIQAVVGGGRNQTK